MVKTTKRAAHSVSLSTRIAPPLRGKCRAHFRSDRFLKAGLIALLALILCSAAIGAAGAEIPDEVQTVTTVSDLQNYLTGNADFNIKLGENTDDSGSHPDVYNLTQECNIKKNGKLDHIVV